MRLWDYRLLKVLPDRFIISQWRECIAIKRQWEKGTLKHRLVSYVMDYEPEFFVAYTFWIRKEMGNRGIKYQDKYYKEIESMCTFGRLSIFDLSEYKHYPEHNDRYLKQCYYNLQEKADRGIITKEEWKLIHKNIYGLIEEEK